MENKDLKKENILIIDDKTFEIIMLFNKLTDKQKYLLKGYAMGLETVN